jgi:hypothetical protein
MFYGGSLKSHPTFEKILSIGYEFETHDLAKFSLHKNDRSLINSDLTLRLLQDKMKMNSVKVIDDNYLSVRIPINEVVKGSKSTESSKKSEGNATNQEELEALERAYQEEFGEEEEEEEEEMDSLQREFLEEFEEQNEFDELERRENDSYLEYFNENRKKDNKRKIKFQATNDIGDVGFGDMLHDLCKGSAISKNDMYFFRTKMGKLYDFKFAESTTKLCQTFTGVEFVITYYKPKQRNANVILETFVDACSRILDHFADLKKTNGTLLITRDKKNVMVPVGKLGAKRNLYHKPGSNLFYLDTYDDEDWKVKAPPRPISSSTSFAQMTFRCKASDAIEIMKQIVLSDTSFKVGKRAIREQQTELDDILTVETMVDELFEEFNKTRQNKKKIKLNTVLGKTLKCYVFLMFYKLFMYVQAHTLILFKEGVYLKDYLTFASRHPNADLYFRIKKILNEHYGITEREELLQFFVQPKVLVPLYEFGAFYEEDYNEDGEYIYGDALATDLKKPDVNYGNPLYSISSYFQYFEDPASTVYDDWLQLGRLDTFTTTFPLKDDIVLLENRFFKTEVGLWARNFVSKDIHKNQLSVNEMYKIANAFYPEKQRARMLNLENNMEDNKLRKKCQPGFVRMPDQKCGKKVVKKTEKTKPANKKTTVKKRVRANKDAIE